MIKVDFFCQSCGKKSHPSSRSMVCECGGFIRGNIGLGFQGDVVKDAKGTPIWFPKDGKPYFDPALGKTIYSKKEKAQIMKEKKLIMTGDDSKKFPVEAGDMRNKSHRRAMRLED